MDEKRSLRGSSRRNRVESQPRPEWSNRTGENSPESRKRSELRLLSLPRKLSQNEWKNLRLRLSGGGSPGFPWLPCCSP